MVQKVDMHKLYHLIQTMISQQNMDLSVHADANKPGRLIFKDTDEEDDFVKRGSLHFTHDFSKVIIHSMQQGNDLFFEELATAIEKEFWKEVIYIPSFFREGIYSEH